MKITSKEYPKADQNQHYLFELTIGKRREDNTTSEPYETPLTETSVQGKENIMKVSQECKKTNHNRQHLSELTIVY